MYRRNASAPLDEKVVKWNEHVAAAGQSRGGSKNPVQQARTEPLDALKWATSRKIERKPRKKKPVLVWDRKGTMTIESR